MRKIIELKIIPPYYDNVVEGSKTFEVRKNDRYYCVGDVLILNEYLPDKQQYTGRRIVKVVDYIFIGGNFGIDKDYVVMSIK